MRTCALSGIARQLRDEPDGWRSYNVARTTAAPIVDHFDAPPPSVSSPGNSVSASTHAGASCDFELRDIVWRRSSHALDGSGCAMAAAGAGRASVKASCALTRQAAAKKIANAARGNIKCTRLIHTQPALQALSLMRPDLQAVRHFENRRQDAEYN